MGVAPAEEDAFLPEHPHVHQLLGLGRDARPGRAGSAALARTGEADAAVGDQQRVATPAEALKQGADYLVVGRPITAAIRPRQVVQKILEAMEDV